MDCSCMSLACCCHVRQRGHFDFSFLLIPHFLLDD